MKELIKHNLLPALGCIILGVCIGHVVGKVNANDSGGKLSSDSANVVSFGPRALSNLAGGSGHRVRASRFEDIMKLPRANDRHVALALYYSGLKHDAYAFEADRLDKLEDRYGLGAQDDHRMILYRTWMDRYPRDAYIHASSNYFGGSGRSAGMLAMWASRAPEEASQYYTDEVRPHMIRMAEINGRVQNPLAQAPQLHDQAILMEWLRQDPVAAMEWAKSLPASEHTVDYGLMGITRPTASPPERSDGQRYMLKDGEFVPVEGRLWR